MPAGPVKVASVRLQSLLNNTQGILVVTFAPVVNVSSMVFTAQNVSLLAGNMSATSSLITRPIGSRLTSGPNEIRLNLTTSTVQSMRDWMAQNKVTMTSSGSILQLSDGSVVEMELLSQAVAVEYLRKYDNIPPHTLLMLVMLAMLVAT